MQLPSERKARVDVLVVGSLTSETTGVKSSCTLIRDGDRVIVVDPGMAESAREILDPIEALGLRVDDVTDVVLGHHHPDHTIHAGHFPNAAIHDHWAIYRGTDWEDSDAEGRVLSPSVILARTPGHTPEDISVLAGTADGIVVCTHAWFDATRAVDRENGEDPTVQHHSREEIAAVAAWIIPGHGPGFRPDASTPL